MDRRPRKRHLTWFGNRHPDAAEIPYAPRNPSTLGKMWRQDPQGGEETDNWLLRENDTSERHTPEPRAPEKQSPEKVATRQPGWETLPYLPPWPPLPEEDPFAASRPKGGSDVRPDINSHAEHRDASGWDPPAAHPDDLPDKPRDGRLRALWWKYVATVRHPRLLLAVVAGTLALCSIFSLAALGNAFLNQASNDVNGTPGARGSNGALVSASASAGQTTPGATATSAETPIPTQTPVPLTIAFTCSSGVAGGAGQLCVHTAPHAALSLTVRYCDNTYAKGKAFHGADYADSNGNYTWRWIVNTNCIGAATATVVAKSAGRTVTQSTTFPITR